MFRSLIIVTLLATQLLAGSAGAAFLCVCNDGSSVCICPGPDACTCCRESCERSPESCADKPSNEAVSERCCENCADDPVKSDVFFAVDSAPCGCTYIPLVAESVQPTTLTRSAIMDTVEWYVHFVALLPTSVGRDEVDMRPPPWHWLQPRAIPDFSLTVILTVVIRC